MAEIKKIKKILIADTGNKFYLKDLEQDFHTEFGFIKKEDLKKAKDGETLTTNSKKELSIFSPSFIDSYEKISRLAQIIPLKDIGSIVAYTGINNKSKIVDAGAGSGALACFLANIAKEVTTYDIREDHLNVVIKNIEFLGLKNVKTKLKDIYEGIDEKNIDLLTLDLPEPWKALASAEASLKTGGFIVSYSPTIPQISDFVNAVNDSKNLIHLRTIEILEREWEIDQRRVRPRSQAIGHSGFLSFVRKIKV